VSSSDDVSESHLGLWRPSGSWGGHVGLGAQVT